MCGSASVSISGWIDPARSAWASPLPCRPRRDGGPVGLKGPQVDGYRKLNTVIGAGSATRRIYRPYFK